MDYLKHYNLLIEKAKSRDVIENVYYETHHIIPKCIGGDNSPLNLVELLPEEHYTAHLLLAKAYPKMGALWYSCLMMSRNLTGRKNKLYGWVRRHLSIHQKQNILDAWAIKGGFKNYQDQCNVVWDLYVTKEVHVNTIANELGIATSNIRRSLIYHAGLYYSSHILRRARFKHISKRSKKTRGNFTIEQEENRRIARKKVGYENHQRGEQRAGSNNPAFGRNWKLPEIQCPHCLKIVKGKRWHFNNCKEKT